VQYLDVDRMAKDKVDAFGRANIREPVPREHAFRRDDQIVPVRGHHLEKSLAGMTAGQVTDLAGSRPLCPKRRFPAPSSGSQSSMGPANFRQSDEVVPERVRRSRLSGRR
jgi:hypothetical protein